MIHPHSNDNVAVDILKYSARSLYHENAFTRKRGNQYYYGNPKTGEGSVPIWYGVNRNFRLRKNCLEGVFALCVICTMYCDVDTDTKYICLLMRCVYIRTIFRIYELYVQKGIEFISGNSSTRFTTQCRTIKNFRYFYHFLFWRLSFTNGMDLRKIYYVRNW